MKHKVLGSVFVLAVALGMISVTLRTPQTTPTKAPTAPAPIETTTPAVAESPAKTDVPHMDRALASYRVYENGIERGMDFRGAGYTAEVAETGVRFGTPECSLLLGKPAFEQGGKSIETAPASFAHPSFGVARLERGLVTEEYLFENRRMEQLFRIASALGNGALTIRVPLATTFPAVIENRRPSTDAFDAVEFRDGGVAVLNPAGETKFTCTTAVAFDSRKNRITLTPRHENGAIVLEIPEGFMARAGYPIVVDPWFGTGGSSTGGGISGTASTSDRPALKDNIIAWADHSSGNWEIYAKVWTGSGFGELAGGASGGGVSSTPGDSLNPAVVSTGATPMIAWEENTGTAKAIYLKQLPLAKSGASWTELGGSATNLGISGNISLNTHPSVGLLKAVVPGIVTIDPTTGIPNGSPASFPIVPVVAWSVGGIYVAAYYPGAPAIPPIGVNPGLPAVPEGWYGINPTGGGVGVTSTFGGYASIGAGENPQLVVDAANQITVAWDAILGNNVEILASRWTLTGAGGNFQVVAGSTSRLDMLPAANFRGIAGATPFDNVSNTAGQSQFPSLCLDSAGGLAIAWQETEAVGTPAVAPPASTIIAPAQISNSQIYLARTAGPPGSAWGPVGGSTSFGGLSRTGLAYDGNLTTPVTPGNASTPSVDSGGGYLGVAWADTSNSRSSIYVRRCLIAGGTWDSIGFQGSAFPPRFFGESAPIGGISKSPSFSFQPQIQMQSDSPLVIWADGSGSTFDILGASFWPNGPGEAVNIGTPQVDFQLTIRQTATDPTLPGGATDIPVGDFTVGTSLFISSRVFSEAVLPAPTSMWMEIELQPTGTAFTTNPNYQVLFTGPDFPTTLPPVSLAVLQIDGLPNNNYHYQTRTVDNYGRVSPWFEQTNIGGVSFRVNASASQGGTGGSNTTTLSAGNTRSKGKCGLLGLEAVAALGLIRLLRRKRSK